MKRVAVVTGGGSGIGRSICHHLARRGNAVAVVDVNGEAAEQVAKEIRTDGAQASGCQADVSDRAQVENALLTTRAQFGPVGILVSNAAVANVESFAEITSKSWNRMLAVVLTGAFHCVQAAISDMVEARWGRVVPLSSSSAQRGAPRMAHYASAKGGVIALTKTLALEYASFGITVNNIAPSVVDTPSVHRKQAAGILPSSEVMGSSVPVGRMGTGGDIASACVFLSSEEASYITGQTLSVNGGSFVG